MTVWDDPAGNIERLYRERLAWNERDVLAELRSLQPLPPERGRTWDSEQPWEAAQLLVAHGAVASERRVRSAVPLILDRMCLGDPGEMMRGMRHSLEAAVGHDYARLAALCADACSSPNPGARYWAVQELAVLEECSTVPVAVALLRDPEAEVAEAACETVVRLARACLSARDEVINGLDRARSERSDIRHAVDEALQDLTLDAGDV